MRFGHLLSATLSPMGLRPCRPPKLCTISRLHTQSRCLCCRFVAGDCKLQQMRESALHHNTMSPQRSARTKIGTGMCVTTCCRDIGGRIGSHQLLPVGLVPRPFHHSHSHASLEETVTMWLSQVQNKRCQTVHHGDSQSCSHTSLLHTNTYENGLNMFKTIKKNGENVEGG